MPHQLHELGTVLLSVNSVWLKTLVRENSKKVQAAKKKKKKNSRLCKCDNTLD